MCGFQYDHIIEYDPILVIPVNIAPEGDKSHDDNVDTFKSFSDGARTIIAGALW